MGIAQPATAMQHNSNTGSSLAVLGYEDLIHDGSLHDDRSFVQTVHQSLLAPWRWFMPPSLARCTERSITPSFHPTRAKQSCLYNRRATKALDSTGRVCLG
jgi:hypothetical protein